VSTGRLEAFSDGVIAVAITLLVLNLSVPSPASHHTLAHNLAKNWPSYVAYVISFATIGIIWINHHTVISRLRETDRAILALNLLLLMSIGVLPFTTDLVAQYISHAGRDQQLAAFLYSVSLLVMSLAFASLIWQTLFPKAHLLRGELSEVHRRRILKRSLTGLLPYAVATVVAPFSPYLTFAICGLVAAFYASPLSVPRT